jgi:hypothetical protein
MRNNPTMKPHRGVVILVFGILGLVVCQPLGIAAWVMGNTDLDEMSLGRMDPSGADLTNAGRICGIVASAIMGLQILLMIIFGLTILARS